MSLLFTFFAMFTRVVIFVKIYLFSFLSRSNFDNMVPASSKFWRHVRRVSEMAAKPIFRVFICREYDCCWLEVDKAPFDW